MNLLSSHHLVRHLQEYFFGQVRHEKIRNYNALHVELNECLQIKIKPSLKPFNQVKRNKDIISVLHIRSRIRIRNKIILDPQHCIKLYLWQWHRNIIRAILCISGEGHLSAGHRWTVAVVLKALYKCCNNKQGRKKLLINKSYRRNQRDGERRLLRWSSLWWKLLNYLNKCTWWIMV